MPKIILARTSGFCMGVKRAMQIAMQTAAKAPGRVFTSGPLIHNPQAVDYLRQNGVGTVKDWHSVKNGTIIIRAHGMPAGQIKEIAAQGLEIVDATCP
ncbi:MAG TPA: 4-hydroxy-3-methylbut-2-enyl diphosphate reductase, partial [Candidatus Rifleibacterium sp.]|nr:4-hydroxy-3-methylbut-2-enyl diphosphate reductase [Candidatus Rifleibacterium sp.]